MENNCIGSFGTGLGSPNLFSSFLAVERMTQLELKTSGSLSSLRDINEEVLMHEQGPEFQKMSSLPETLVWACNARLSVEKDGMSWMT